MKKSSFIAMVLGTAGVVLFALGMCMALIPEWNAFKPVSYTHLKRSGVGFRRGLSGVFRRRYHYRQQQPAGKGRIKG